MTKHEFMTQLADALHKKNVADAADIMEEYEQHFAFKLADGYSEEEIAAGLGNPVTLAAQFGEAAASVPNGGHKPLVVAGLCIADLFSGLLYVLLAAWEVVLAVASVSFAVVAVCLLGRLELYGIPTVPYGCAAILAVACAALAVLGIVGCVYYAAFLRQLARAYGRFHRNALAGASGGASLPPLPVAPQFLPKTKRSLRAAALIALAVFAVGFVLAFIACSLSAGTLQFWHAWNWFGGH